MRRIKAIETKYAGRYFRSRLEARWAVWFTEMGVPWEYEIVGYEVAGQRYLPDFSLPAFEAHAEIKPLPVPEKELQRIAYVMQNWTTDGAIMLIAGVPAYRQYTVTMGHAMGWRGSWMFGDCRRCDGVGMICDDEWSIVGDHTCGDHDRAPIADGPRIMRAYETAMRYRFDHRRGKP